MSIFGGLQLAIKVERSIITGAVASDGESPSEWNRASHLPASKAITEQLIMPNDLATQQNVLCHRYTLVIDVQYMYNVQCTMTPVQECTQLI